MNYLSWTIFFVITASFEIQAASFNLNGEIIESEITKKTTECDSYQVVLENEYFPYKHELKIPKEFRIKNFHGSSAIVNKSAFILPGKIAIPRPSQIEGIEGQYPRNRTYLPNSVVCKGDILIVSYWSGGNCKECEAFLQFKILNGVPTNPQTVDYDHFKELEK